MDLGLSVASSGAPKTTILNPGRLSANARRIISGTCARKETNGDWTNKWKVAPTYLSEAGRLFQSRTLTCLTCHDPHAPPEPEWSAPI